jgi:hypothetical protein
VLAAASASVATLYAMLTTDQKGAIAETSIAAAAIRLGIGVFRPIAVERYDLIFDLRPELIRVQCKWAAHHGDVLVIRCRSCRRSRDGLVRRVYTADEVDAIAAHCDVSGRCYFLPLERFEGRSAIQLRLSRPGNNQKAGVNWAEAFDFDATLRAFVGP